MKTYRTETIVTLTSGTTLALKGHVSAAEILAHLEAKFPTKEDGPGPVPFRGRAAHLEPDGYNSVKNFSFTEIGQEFDVWAA